MTTPPPKRPDRSEWSAREADFLAGYDPRGFSPVAVTVDIALMTLLAGRLAVLLVRRAEPPYRAAWALPGGFVRPHETLDQAAIRELREETGVADFGGHFEQLATYGQPDRDPRMRVISAAYLAITSQAPTPAAGTDAEHARYWPVEDLEAAGHGRDVIDLAFDHDQIVADAVERTRAKLEYTTLGTRFCPAEFTIADLRRVYEAVWDTPLDPANFQRKLLASADVITATDAHSEPRSHGGRPARLYRRGPASVLTPPLLRPVAKRNAGWDTMQ